MVYREVVVQHPDSNIDWRLQYQADEESLKTLLAKVIASRSW